MDVQVSIWLASETRWVHLTKVLDLPAVPRVGEYIRLNSAEVGDYFNWRITQVTHHEHGPIDVWTGLHDIINGNGYSFETEDEFDEWLKAYTDAGWTAPRGVGPNRRSSRRIPSLRSGDTVVTIDLARVASADELHSAFAKALGFPEFYGRNWDAWIDCMTSLDRPDEVLTTLHVEEGKVLTL